MDNSVFLSPKNQVRSATFLCFCHIFLNLDYFVAVRSVSRTPVPWLEPIMASSDSNDVIGPLASGSDSDEILECAVGRRRSALRRLQHCVGPRVVAVVADPSLQLAEHKKAYLVGVGLAASEPQTRAARAVVGLLALRWRLKPVSKSRPALHDVVRYGHGRERGLAKCEVHYEIDRYCGLSVSIACSDMPLDLLRRSASQAAPHFCREFGPVQFLPFGACKQRYDSSPLRRRAVSLLHFRKQGRACCASSRVFEA